MNHYQIRIKWLARIIGGLAILYYIISFAGVNLPYPYQGSAEGLRSMTMLLVFALAGYLFAWWRAKEGGIVMAIAGMVLGLDLFYQGGAGNSYNTLMISLPVLISGLMFWWIGRGRMPGEESQAKGKGKK
jgi:hypothetical protein